MTTGEIEGIKTERSPRGVTVRAAAIGLGVLLFVNAWATYTEMYVRASRLTISHFPLALFATFLLLLLANRYLRLTSGELIVILSMGLVGAVIPVEGVVGFLLGIISSFTYFASPENQWDDFLLPYLPRWLVPQGSPEMWTQFFETGTLDQGIPWAIWVPPLLWWSVFIGVTLWVTTCLMVILRRQWQDHERLVYPLTAVALDLLQSDDGRGKSIVHQSLFWWGLGLPFALRAWDSVSWFTHVPLPLTGIYGYRTFFIFKEAIPLVVNPFQFFSIGFGYFANTDILFSIWFFFLIHVTQSAIFARLGFSLPGAKGDQFSATPAPTSFQGFGALCFLVFWGLWVARDHLKTVWKATLGGPANVDDSRELLSYRTTGRGALIGFGFLLLWLHASGMTFIESGLFLFASFVIYVGMARIVAETGVLYTWGTLSPQTFVFTVVGSQSMSGTSAVSILLSYGLINYLRGLFGPALAHVARLGTLTAHAKRRLVWAVLGGAGVALAFTFWFTLELAYRNGAYNTYGYPTFFSGNPKGIFTNTLAKIRNPFTTGWPQLAFAGLGAALMALFTLLRSRLTWWRLHPIGFAMSAMINTQHLALPLFIAWSAKSVLLATGGARLHRRATPLFIGLIVGYVAGVALSSGIDTIWFPGQGHRVHDW